MPSEFAKTLNFELDARAPQRRSVEVIDAELQEVREVIDGLIAIAGNGIGLSTDDEAMIQRARALYRRLAPAAQDAAGER